MTIKSSGNPLSFSEIEAEFGSNGSRSLGNYRLTQSIGQLSNLPLDSGIPTSGQIKFSDFYGKRLNIVVDCHSGGREDRKSAKNDKWNNNNLTVIGGFRSKKEDGSKIIIHVNKKFCSNKDAADRCALRTGGFNSSSTVQVDLGSSARILGAGGDGGNGQNGIDGGLSGGGTGTSALGIEHNGAVVNVSSGAIIRAGFGGGGGGGGGQQVDKGSDRRASGGGGGGGAGCPPGNGGQGGSVQSGDGNSFGRNGSNGTETNGGNGGSGGDNDDQAGGRSGGSGGDAQGNAGAAQGGAGGNGAAIRRTSGFNVTINNSGTIAGSTTATGVS